jgi:hypothetical protein
MQFFLTEILARAVAAYLLFDSVRILRRAWAERKVEYIETDWINWILHGNFVAHRDTMPFWYWSTMCGYVTAVLACTVVAIFGWWMPN